jgi:hypothetical protein
MLTFQIKAGFSNECSNEYEKCEEPKESEGF